MRFLLATAMLFLGFAAPAFAQYPANAIQWRPADDGVPFGSVWGYDANGDIACPSNDGASCLVTRDLAAARAALATFSCGAQMEFRTGVTGYDTEGHPCRLLALRHGNQDGVKWNAPAQGANIYWRRNPATGNIECASGGGACFFAVPTLAQAFKSTQVTACQAADYQQAGHWCHALASERRGNGYDWKPYLRMTFDRPIDEAVEMHYFSYGTTGDLQCPSHDGVTCFLARTREEAQAATQPLACDASGYDTAGHWCRTTAFVVGNEPGFAYRFGSVGLIAGAGAPEVMCASPNGVSCIGVLPLSTSFKFANPLVCGSDAARRFGDSAYFLDFCRQFAVPEMRGRHVRVHNTSDVPVRVCSPVWFGATDHDPRFASIRCTDLAGSPDGQPTTTGVTLLPLGTHAGTRTVHQTLCVEAPGKAGLFIGPVVGDSADVFVEPNRIRADQVMLDITAGSRTCRDAFATLSNL